MRKFALAGNPNSGKTTLFNALTGSTAHVGNWPGVTVDTREGVYKRLAEHVAIVDLPGIYSLSPYTPEEVIARNFILEEKPDCVIDIVDATNLERNKRHLESLGIVPGSSLRLLSVSGGSVILRIREGRLAIDRSLACKILV